MKFEYISVPLSELETPYYSEIEIDKLNKYGEKGWELITIISGDCIFKRVKTE